MSIDRLAIIKKAAQKAEAKQRGITLEEEKNVRLQKILQAKLKRPAT